MLCVRSPFLFGSKTAPMMQVELHKQGYQHKQFAYLPPEIVQQPTIHKTEKEWEGKITF